MASPKCVAAHAVKEEFDKILVEVAANPSKIIVWREILQKYNPTLIGECEKAIKWSKEMVCSWLESNMLKHDKDKAKVVVEYLPSHQDTYTHDRHLDFNILDQLGLVIEKLEDDQELQAKVLSVHHSAIISMSQTQATKIIENNMGKAYIQSI